MAGKLPPEAFEYYVGLGPGRSYQAVADHFETSKRAVSYRAKQERWPERFEALVRATRSTPTAGAGTDGEDGGDARVATRSNALQEALHEVVNPLRFRAIVASLVKAAVQKDDVGAAKFLIDRVLGKPRTEVLPATAIDLPNGLESTTDVRRAANAILQGVINGTVSPDEAQKAATVVEAARKAIETEDLERRLAAVEERQKAEQNP